MRTYMLRTYVRTNDYFNYGEINFTRFVRTKNNITTMKIAFVRNRYSFTVKETRPGSRIPDAFLDIATNNVLLCS